MSDIFREIDEELRRDRLAQVWKRYGSFIIGLAVILVVATGGVTAWREYQHGERRQDGVTYTNALVLAQGGQVQEAIQALGGLGSGADHGHAFLARFQMAALQAQAGDRAAAIATYQAIADDGGVDPIYRDLATLMVAMQGLESGDPAAIIAKLQPVASGSGPWRPSALEVTALAQLRAGDKQAAIETYKRLADDLAAPSGLRARAAEMVQALNA